MSDRKYRQRGYQDEPREPRGEKKPEAKKEYTPRGQPPISPKTFSMPGFREVVKCVRCGSELTVAAAWSAAGQCPKCQSELHSCAQCANFDSSATFECGNGARMIAARSSAPYATLRCHEQLGHDVPQSPSHNPLQGPPDVSARS